MGGLKTRLTNAKKIEKFEATAQKARETHKELDDLQFKRDEHIRLREAARPGAEEENPFDQVSFLSHHKAANELNPQIAAKEKALQAHWDAMQKEAPNVQKARQEQAALGPSKQSADIKTAMEGRLTKLKDERAKLEGHWNEVADKTEPKVVNHYRREFKRVDKAIETQKRALADHGKEEQTVAGLEAQGKQKHEAHAKYQETAQRNLETVQRMAQKDAAMSDWKIKASMTWNQMAGATASVVSPAGEAIGATYTLDGATESADAKKLTAGQESENMDYQRQMSTADSWIEAFKKGLDVMSTTTQAAVEMSKTAARNIA
jgi:hypothetical protein